MVVWLFAGFREQVEILAGFLLQGLDGSRKIVLNLISARFDKTLLT